MLKRKVVAVLQQEQGSILPVVCLLVMLLAIVGKALFPVVTADMMMTGQFRDGIAAQYLAEAGINKAIFNIENDYRWAGIPEPGEESSVGNAKGRFFVTISSANHGSDAFIIKATGIAGQARRTIRMAYVWPPVSDIYEVYTLFSADTLTISDLASVESESVKYGSRSLTKVAENNVTEASNLTDLKIPIIQAASYQNMAVAPPTSLEISSGQGLSGIIYYSGAMYELAQNTLLPGNGVIYSTNSIILQNGVRLTGRVTLISEGSIIIGSGSTLRQTLLIARQNIDVKDKVTFSGIAVAGGKMSIGSGSIIRRDDSVLKKIYTNYTYY